MYRGFQETVSSHLRNVHDRVTAEGPGRGEGIGAQQGGDDAILVDTSDHGAIHEINEPKLVHCNSWGGEGKPGINSPLDLRRTWVVESFRD